MLQGLGERRGRRAPKLQTDTPGTGISRDSDGSVSANTEETAWWLGLMREELLHQGRVEHTGWDEELTGSTEKGQSAALEVSSPEAFPHPMFVVCFSEHCLGYQ